MRIVFGWNWKVDNDNKWSSRSSTDAYWNYYRDYGKDEGFPMSYLRRVCEGKKG